MTNTEYAGYLAVQNSHKNLHFFFFFTGCVLSPMASPIVEKKPTSYKSDNPETSHLCHQVLTFAEFPSTTETCLHVNL